MSVPYLKGPFIVNITLFFELKNVQRLALVKAQIERGIAGRVEKEAIMKLGYARVSTEDQKLDLQIQALKQAGCDEIYTDYAISGVGLCRPGLEEVLSNLAEGDTLVVWRLDRLGRSLVRLVHLMDHLGDRGIDFHSLTENIDTGSSGGRLVFHIIAALSEFERTLISERTRAGMAAAKKNGRVLGRPRLLPEEKLEEAIVAIRVRGESLVDVAGKYDVPPRTLQRMIAARKQQMRRVDVNICSNRVG